MMVLVLLFVFSGPLFYIDVLQGEKYNDYTQGGVDLFTFLGVVTIILIFFSDVVLLKLKKLSVVSEVDTKFWGQFLFCFFLMSLVYLVLNFSKLPIFSIITGSAYIRPDIVSTDLRGFFSFSIISNVILPLCFIYLFNNSKNKWILFFCFLYVSFCFVVGGNKGGLFFFIVFCLFFLFDKKNILTSAVVITLIFGLYALIKMSEGATITLEYLLSSMFERLFVVQGISLPNILTSYVDGLDFYSLSSNEIKRMVFFNVYGYSPGSMPLYFYTEVLIRFSLMAFFSLILFYFIFNTILLHVSSKFNSRSVSWLIYSFHTTIVIAGVNESSVFRFLTVFVLFFVYFLMGAKKNEIVK
ncbi:hypothetical protein J4H18_09200 [Vibrio alginolyticus]|uniref:hypothetical protein n=1 Tax=Vibrio alginolyticus TaxID=663 RepID=UPI001BD6A314|nr:hypothetical protein [Vibrio alginolyticus]MBS9864159.1 hypothetical protein [Vibrio alginolyticus]MBS9887344.1 hypothetical protein [Vibrio alginolyticus]